MSGGGPKLPQPWPFIAALLFAALTVGGLGAFWLREGIGQPATPDLTELRVERSPGSQVGKLYSNWMFSGESQADGLVPSAPPPVCVPRNQVGRVYSQLRTARTLADDGRRAQAIESARLSAQNNPDLPIATVVFAELLHDEGATEDAIRVLAGLLDRRAMKVRRQKIAARDRRLSVDEVRGIMHAQALHAYLALQSNKTDSSLWLSLKSPIAAAKWLQRNERSRSRRRQAEETCAYELQDNACPAANQNFTTQTLYNNLLIGYLRLNWRGSEESILEEFQRRNQARSTAPALTEMVEELGEQARDGELEQQESTAWAVSNAERLLDCAAGIQDARLSNTMLQSILRGADLVPGYRDDIQPTAEALAQSAWGQRAQLTNSEQAALATGLLRAGWQYGTSLPVATDELVGVAPLGSSETLNLIAALESTRRNLTLSDGLPTEMQSELATNYGALVNDWSDAVRQDLALGVAAEAVRRQDDERRALFLHAARLHGNAARTRAYRALRGDLSSADRFTLMMQTSPVGRSLPWLFGLFLVGALLFLSRKLIALAREHVAIFDSFYRRETRYWASKGSR